jgi:hypothetical protein
VYFVEVVLDRFHRFLFHFRTDTRVLEIGARNEGRYVSEFKNQQRPEGASWCAIKKRRPPG